MKKQKKKTDIDKKDLKKYDHLKLSEKKFNQTLKVLVSPSPTK